MVILCQLRHTTQSSHSNTPVSGPKALVVAELSVTFVKSVGKKIKGSALDCGLKAAFEDTSVGMIAVVSDKCYSILWCMYDLHVHTKKESI